MAGVSEDLRVISQLPGWDSPAADAARGTITAAARNVLDDAAVIGAVQALAEETASGVAKLQGELADLRAAVAANRPFMQLEDDGDITVNAPADQFARLESIAQDLVVRAKALIKQAEDIDADCAEVFGHLAHGDVTAHGATDMASAVRSGRDQSGLSAPYPPEGEDVTPADVNAWWDALSTDEQRKVVAEHPDWIRNRDGVEVWARHQANVAVLDREYADAKAALDELGSREDFITNFKKMNPNADPLVAGTAYDTRRAAAQARFDDAQALKKALSVGGDIEKGYDPNRYLMLLDLEQDETQAAIAVGNPDTAEHVSVTTPGMDTHATSLPDIVNEAGALQSEALTQLERVGRAGESVATIAWLGYDPPDTGDLSIAAARNQDCADQAAPDLADFYRGINATNEHGAGVHLSAFGHSYGSLTTAQALNELGETGVVDDAAFYGSPGLGVTDEGTFVGPMQVPSHAPIDDEADLFLPDGHAYVMAAADDPIAETWRVRGVPLPSVADLALLGPDPSTLPFEQLATGEAVTPDGQHRDGATGHADYPRVGSDQRTLRTTGYNLAIIAAGLAHDPAHPDLLERR
ncbi:alpha/beta hydrolase family protein [Mycobacterium sp. MYCO198283]|uniref:alpha/beta hydrolase n=1 Tax=Mycobacterium sp. MYCO198283 TaxID=2883505 RepID=UPI001E5591B4|nr:alpha/beta hydrolase [Mycobacterium sp. MYCO198283]MCG5432961.1 alpha/beta hydrolase family protein [Mycobacterium sp. MYCO198283]